jgi:hypothetical protein
MQIRATRKKIFLSTNAFSVPVGQMKKKIFSKHVLWFNNFINIFFFYNTIRFKGSNFAQEK